MKIFSALQIKEADKATIEKQGITSVELMERAAQKAFLWIKEKFPHKATLFHIYCGQGNNGGDGLVIARLLLLDGYGNIKVEIVDNTGNGTDDFTLNKQRLEQAGIFPENINGSSVGGLVIIDAIFGIGLSRELSENVRQAIASINAKEATVISIDVPSGLFLDRNTDIAVKSDVVLTFQFPKLAFFLPGNKKFINKVEILDIGLDEDYIHSAPTKAYYIDSNEAVLRFKPLQRYAHKGIQGHSLIIGGSYGKIGAVCLSAKAALKSGCGLVTAYLPECGYTAIQCSFPEAMALTDGNRHITKIDFDIQPKAIGIGPGLGTHPETVKAFGDFLKQNNIPLVIDADALNILSENKDWLALLPENSILTPHPKELERLIGDWADDFEKLEKLKTFSKKYKLIIIAKDTYTMIVHNDTVFVNSTGNPGLATGGSGDVLTGIITGMLAQSYTAQDVAVFGVYLHGLSADIGVEKLSRQAFTASDIITHLGDAYLKIEEMTASK